MQTIKNSTLSEFQRTMVLSKVLQIPTSLHDSLLGNSLSAWPVKWLFSMTCGEFGTLCKFVTNNGELTWQPDIQPTDTHGHCNSTGNVQYPKLQ